MEWDTAAGHAVAHYSDCKVYDYKTGSELKYNKENMLNPWFVVAGNIKKPDLTEEIKQTV